MPRSNEVEKYTICYAIKAGLHFGPQNHALQRKLEYDAVHCSSSLEDHPNLQKRGVKNEK